MSARELSSQPPHVTQFSALYVDHHGWLQSWLRKKLRCSHHAADLAQDIFVRLLLKPEPTQLREPRAFLTRIAHGLVIDHYRRQSLERAYLEVLATVPEAQVPSPESQLLIVETLCRLDAMLATLPALTRKVFLLSQLDGLKYAEIAEQLAVSLITVKRHMLRAFRACLSVT